MGEIPDRFADEDLNEKQRTLLALVAEYDEPDTPLSELADQTPWSRKTCQKWLDRLEGRGLARARQLPGQETWMYGIAHPASAHGVPGDLDLPAPGASDDPSATWGEKVLVAGATVFVAAMAAAALVAAAGDYNLLRPGFISAIQAWIGLAYIGSLAAVFHGTWTTVKERGGWRRHFQNFTG